MPSSVGSANTDSAPNFVDDDRARRPWLLGGILGGAVLLRFGTLSLQSYWSDEAATVDLVKRSLGQMLATIPKTERTPPAYYVLAWVWSRLFGTGEVGLRSLSALFGTLTVVCAYAIARRLGGERAGLLAAALTTVSPILVWYSQEARSYAMLTFLSAASIWLWLRARDAPSTRATVAWGVVSCLAIATHYFASFIVVFEAISLWRAQRDRTLGAVLALLVVVQVALIPLAIQQGHTQDSGDYITSTALSSRIIQVPERFLLGEHWTRSERDLLGGVLVASVLVAVWLLAARLDRTARGRVAAIVAIAVAAVLLPLGLALVGLDFFAPRNLLAVWVLVLVVGAVALSESTGRAAEVATIALLAAFTTMTVATDADTSLQRADWRFAPQALGQPRWGRLIVVGPSFEDGVLEIYLPAAHLERARRVRVREVDLVGYRLPPRLRPPSIVAGFYLVGVVDHQSLSFVRYLSRRPLAVDTRRLPALLGGSRTVLIEPGRRSAQGRAPK